VEEVSEDENPSSRDKLANIDNQQAAGGPTYRDMEDDVDEEVNPMNKSVSIGLRKQPDANKNVKMDIPKLPIGQDD
jgi:hypothetical protein